MLNRTDSKPHHSTLLSVFWMIFILMIGGGYGLFRLDRTLAQASRNYVQFACRQIAVNSINQAVEELLRDDPTFAQNLYTLQYDKQGKVTAISTDTYRMNQARDTLVSRLSALLVQHAGEKHTVRFGALMGSFLFSIWDPQLQMNISPRIYTQGRIDTSLCAAGINQTQFTVSVSFDIGMSTSIINYESRADMNMKVPLVELVLMGDTPNYFSR